MPTTPAAKSRSSKTTRPMAAPPAEVPPVAAQPDPALIDPDLREALVRIAAYAFYERRGHVDGQELEDWLRAEMEVDRQLAAARKSKPED